MFVVRHFLEDVVLAQAGTPQTHVTKFDPCRRGHHDHDCQKEVRDVKMLLIKDIRIKMYTRIEFILIRPLVGHQCAYR